MDTENWIEAVCPCCGESVSYAEELRGTGQSCPHCAKTLIVPVSGASAMKLPVPIPTMRLSLRRLRTDDIQDVAEFMSDADLLEYLPVYPGTFQDVQDWIHKDSELNLGDGENLCLAIDLSHDHKIIGYVTVGYQDE